MLSSASAAGIRDAGTLQLANSEWPNADLATSMIAGIACCVYFFHQGVNGLEDNERPELEEEDEREEDEQEEEEGRRRFGIAACKVWCEEGCEET